MVWRKPESRPWSELVWAPELHFKDPAIAGSSDLCLAPMTPPWQLGGAPVMPSRPEFDWECRGFLVNEGPSMPQRHGRVFSSYSVSATDESYAMGLLWNPDRHTFVTPLRWNADGLPQFGLPSRRN